MRTHAGKMQENRSSAPASVFSRKGRGCETAFQFADNRPEAVWHRKLQEAASNSARAEQSIQLQAMADEYHAHKERTIEEQKSTRTEPVQKASIEGAGDVIQRVKTKTVATVTVTTDDLGGYPTWDMPAGTKWHINWNGGGVTKKGKALHHVTKESGNPKQHYFFTLEAGVISDAVSGQKGKKKFSNLPSEVQNFVSTNINDLLP